jgi:hypothetical protein
MVKIIGISGRKQSGKNTVANFINGEILKERGMIHNFTINKSGQLEIQTTNDKNETGWGVFDVTRKDAAFVNYAERELWPYVKVYHFADPLKQLAIDLLGFDAVKVYGTDRQKNTKVGIYWEDMAENTENRSGRMTIREFLQHFGTSIMRKMKDDIWVTSTIKKIMKEDSEVALMPDVRFPNEVNAIKENGGVVIRLTRNVFPDTHACESALDEENFDWSNFDYIIDNEGCSLSDLSNKLKNIQEIWRL